MTQAPRILLFDDNPDDRALVTRELNRHFPNLQLVESPGAGGYEEALRAAEADVVITDYHMGATDGLSILRAFRTRDPRIPVIMFTGTGSEEIAVEAMKGGLYDYVLKSPEHLGRLSSAVRRALEWAKSQRALGEAEERYRSLFGGAPVGLLQTTPDGRILDANPALVQILGYPDRGSLLEVRTPDLYLRREDRERWTADLEREGVVRGVEVQLRRRDGTNIWARLSARLVRDEQGRSLYYEGAIEDVTGRKRAEEALRHSEARKANILGMALDAIITIDPEGRITEFNPAAERMFGYARAETLGRELAELIVPAALREKHRAGLARQHATRETRMLGRRVEITAMRKDGSEFPVELALTRDPADELGLFTGFIRDLSERKQAEEALRRSEEQFRQAQKMEAVGRLAGGIAHDFNNLLTVIGGHSDLLLGRLHEADPIRKEIEQIRKAGERAASLTRQLLAFSRRQVLQPRVLDLNRVVAEMDKMMRRLIGEDVELVLTTHRGLAHVKADPGQIEQVIMNLAVNARDAMPHGGKLTIETMNVDLDEAFARRHPPTQPGRYVMLAVSDTGQGMDEEVRSHLFEPFFTTKGLGKGTGLGLATVYGIVKQSGGYVWAFSEPGQGASFKIYLPPVDEAVAAAEHKADVGPLNGTETILLVEDEPVVRALARDILQMRGYTILEALDVNDARRICETHPDPIHLMLTDVVMPQMSGRALADSLTGFRPSMRVLYMSGYTDDAIVQHGVLNPGTPFLQKPFTPGNLARKVREVLDRVTSTPAATKN